MSWDMTLEIARFALGALLVAANVAVWYGVWLERESAPKEVQQKGWRILVRGLAAETAVGFLLFAADTSIGVRQADKLNSAQTIAGKALDTGLTLKTLNSGLEDIVKRQTTEITDAQNQISDLTNKEGNLRSALNMDEQHVREIDAWRRVVIDGLKPRDVAKDSSAKIIAALKGHQLSKPVRIFFLQDLDEGFMYPLSVALALGKSGVDCNLDGEMDQNPPGIGSFPQPINRVGITVYEFPDTGPHGDAMTLAGALNAGGIFVNSIVRPTKAADAIPGAVPMLVVFIGRKPNPFFQLPNLFQNPKMKAIMGRPAWEPRNAPKAVQ